MKRAQLRAPGQAEKLVLAAARRPRQVLNRFLEFEGAKIASIEEATSSSVLSD
jgi:hypothetical protein